MSNLINHFNSMKIYQKIALGVIGVAIFAILVFVGFKIDKYYTNTFIVNEPNDIGMVATQLSNLGWSVSTTYFDTSSTDQILVAPDRKVRHYWLLQNVSTNTQWINFGPTSTAIAEQVPMLSANGNSYDSNMINNYLGEISVATSTPGRMIFVEAYK